jgi:hypothetical protein
VKTHIVLINLFEKIVPIMASSQTETWRTLVQVPALRRGAADVGDCAGIHNAVTMI